MKRNKRLLPILISLTLLSGPVLLVVGCDSKINRADAALSKDLEKRLLFDFLGVSYNVNAGSQFNDVYKQNIEIIKKEIEGIMAKEEIKKFFKDKLNYSEESAEATFIKIQDTLGLNILANDYFTTINSGENFDTKVYNKNLLLFQTDTWHQSGTTRFNYANSEFYNKNNPNDIFNSNFLYSDLTGPEAIKKDEQIQKVAKYADKNYGKEIENLTKEKTRWENSTQKQIPDTLTGNDITSYQKKLQRFKWWLRFRYQQYYTSVIFPELNQTLFTMANILNSILTISNNGEKPTVEINNGKYANQLQDWSTNSTWTSKYRLVWDFTTSSNTASNIDNNWNNNDSSSSSLKPYDLNKNGTDLNSDFFNKLKGTDKALKNNIDPIFGISGFINDTTGKDYDQSVKDKNNNISSWITNNTDGSHYWGKNNKGSFAYSAPIYWIDVILNLNFNYYQDPSTIVAIDSIKDTGGFIGSWKNNSENSPISKSNFSSYIRGDSKGAKDLNLQETKWNIFWQMLYFLSSQIDTNANKDIAKENFTAAAKVFYPLYIPENKVYDKIFWETVSQYYS